MLQNANLPAAIPTPIETDMGNNLQCIPLHHGVFIYISFGSVLEIFFLALCLSIFPNKRGRQLAPGTGVRVFISFHS
jgi:hypothetical protein